MAKFIFLSPRQDMIAQAQSVNAKLKTPLSVEMKLVTSETVVDEADQAFANGAEIAIARGNYASLIKRFAEIPVVEIVLTAQELGLVIIQAKKLSYNPVPVIGLVGFANMFPDVRYFNELFDIELKTYYVKVMEELNDAVSHAIADEVDVIIGGDIVASLSQSSGIPTLFFESTEDSIQQAFRVASSVAYASDLEKKNNSELRALLDFSFNAIIRLNAKGEIQILNHIARNLLEIEEEDVLGQPIEQYVPLEPGHLATVLEDGEEIFSYYLQIKGKEVALNLAPLKLGNHIDGAILSLHEVHKIHELEAEARTKLYLRGRKASFTFADLEQNLVVDSAVLETAKQFAQSEAPLLLFNETGFETELLAQAIHTQSPRAHGPFVPARPAAYDKSEQLWYLFGSGSGSTKEGLFASAHTGTLYIDEISELTSAAQYRLYKLLTEHIIIRDNDLRPLPANIRLIAASGHDLAVLVEEGKFRQDLYYVLNTLSLALTPLHQRPADLEILIDRYIKEFSELYSRYIVLTQGAKAALINYPWSGNHLQVRSFLERLVLSAPRRSVDEIQVSRLLTEAYPIILHRKPEEPIIVYKDPEAAVIAELLQKHQGSRQAVASEMGISTTTLWRKMKKYQITGTFEA